MSSAFLPVSAASRMQIGRLTIPNDIISHVLTAAPNFSTLRAAVGVCATWHGVFAAHPKSVVLSVARNVVGPVLPQAVRFLRYPYPEKTENSWGDNEDEGGDEGDEDETEDETEDEDVGAGVKRKAKKTKPTYSESADIGVLTPKERIGLEKNAETVRKLEELFSRRHKDQTTKTSQLTPLESHRFTRAMYRIMLYCELFYLPLNLDDIDSMESETHTLPNIQRERHAMLNEYPTAELLEIRAVVAFLHGLIGEVTNNDDDLDRVKDICLATGPAVILQAYTEKLEEVFEEALEPEVMSSGEDNPLFGGFFATPLEKIWTERQAVPPESEHDAILDGVMPVQSTSCAQCGVTSSLGLWNQANWSTLINVDFCALLKGKLSENEVESERLVELFMSSKCPSDLVVSEIFDMRSAAFSAWKKDEGLCSGCLDKLMGEHLHLWLYKRKVQDGWTPTDNCWYGYGCKTQVHKRSHAKAKNHLCAPTR
ncbi:hypothetical protein C8R44DRAFT_890691 [Mycena epipterygia]|nr:hypothetical protein C8R44DRAFT_890691 [Mycena epipterygia]